MKSANFLGFFILIFISLTLVAAQAPPPAETKTEQEKKQKENEKRILEMLDQAVGEASALKLSQNRAIVFAAAGDLYWKFDEKHARELFRSAGSEILNANAEAEKDKKTDDNPFADFSQASTFRYEILPVIARRDADLALEIMQQTRPAKIAEAMLKAAQPNAGQGGNMMSFDPTRFGVQREVAMEQQFALLAAGQSPDKAIALIKESLSKGISYNVMPLLQKLNKIDEKKALEVANLVVGKITDSDLSKKRDDLSAAIQFLQSATASNAPKNLKEKQFNFTAEQLKSIADKVTDTLLMPSNSIESSMMISRAMPGLEKIGPARLQLLKQLQAQTAKNIPAEMKTMQRQQNFWSPNSTPEEILAEMPKLNEFERSQAGQALAMKIGLIDDEVRAKKLIEQIPDEKIRANVAESFESAKITRTARDGKLEDARKLIGNLTKKKTQIQKLVALAKDFHKKETDESRETAFGLMKDAKALTSEYPEDEDELDGLMEIVSGYAVIDQAEAFRLFEPVINQMNDVVQASAVLSKYNKRNTDFKKGELIMKIAGGSWNNFLLYKYTSQIKLLGKADLSRMITFADKFQRSDARTMVMLFIAQGYLSDDKTAEPFNTSGIIYTVGS